jgi:hypothetical protein
MRMLLPGISPYVRRLYYTTLLPTEKVQQFYFVTSCTRASKSHLETIKYLINKDLFMYLKHKAFSIFSDIINLYHFLYVVDDHQ